MCVWCVCACVSGASWGRVVHCRRTQPHTLTHKHNSPRFSMRGRVVVWRSWDEWKLVKAQLYSYSHDDVAAALRTVHAHTNRYTHTHNTQSFLKSHLTHHTHTHHRSIFGGDAGRCQLQWRPLRCWSKLCCLTGLFAVCCLC